MPIKRSLLDIAFSLTDRFSWAKRLYSPTGAASVFLFHRVNDYDDDPLTMSTRVFTETLRLFKERYQVASLQDILAGIDEERDSGTKTVAITFDDGYRDNLEVAAPILKDLGVPATFFVTTGYIGKSTPFPWDISNPNPNPTMSWSEVRELAGMGFEIGAHSMTHPNLGEVSLERAAIEVRQSKYEIEAALGSEVLSFAFPFGRRMCCPRSVSDLVKDAGYRCCCRGFGGKVRAQSDPFELDRIPAYPTAMEMLMEVEGFATYLDGNMAFAGVPDFWTRR
jgi:peptidoglycan/xylan/chitin deacetylase (PgdA/CDA1 family)